MVDEELCWNCMGVRFWKSLWKIWGPRHFFDGQTGSFEKSYNQVNHTGIIHRNHPRSLECIANLSLPCGGVHCFLVGLPFSKSLPLAKDETAARDERRCLGWWKWCSDAPRASNGRFIGIHDQELKECNVIILGATPTLIDFIFFLHFIALDIPKHWIIHKMIFCRCIISKKRICMIQDSTTRFSGDDPMLKVTETNEKIIITLHPSQCYREQCFLFISSLCVWC